MATILEVSNWKNGMLVITQHRSITDAYSFLGTLAKDANGFGRIRYDIHEIDDLTWEGILTYIRSGNLCDTTPKNRPDM